MAVLTRIASPYRTLLAVKRRLFGSRLGAARPVPRADYKQTWNRLSVGEDDAKTGVAGYTDERLFDATARATLATLQRTVGVRPTDTILEIGAGVGRVGSVLAPLCKEWIGADVSENMLTHLRRRLKHLPNVRTLALNGYDLAAVADASVDMVYCTVVFMHLEEWERFRYVREAFRVLRPGGRLLVDNYTIVTDDGWKMFEQLLALKPLERPAQVSKPSTPQELDAYFRRAGFRDIGQQLEGLWVFCHGVKPG
ncbi:MAG TPA: class I SAM-dependent methyltransferase [Gemmataceae bacterium]|jgi:ubiquinone/menaquinone biosynthesis C-methylase UbiE